MHYGMTPYQNPCGHGRRRNFQNPYGPSGAYAEAYDYNPYGPSGAYAEAYDYNPPEGGYLPWGLPRQISEEAKEAERKAYEGIAGTLSDLQAYELNPHWGAGGGYYDGRGRWRPGGGRFLDTRHLGRPPYDYHAGGGQRSHGYHPGAGYYANPSYKVRHHTEEFQCPSCGHPVYVGDTAYEDDNGEVFCCRGCAEVQSNPPYYETNPGPPLYGYGHLPYSAAVGPGVVTPLFLNPRRGGHPALGYGSNKFLETAVRRARKGDPGAMEDLLREAWAVMGPEQRARFKRAHIVQEIVGSF